MPTWQDHDDLLLATQIARRGSPRGRGQLAGQLLAARGQDSDRGDPLEGAVVEAILRDREARTERAWRQEDSSKAWERALEQQAAQNRREDTVKAGDRSYAEQQDLRLAGREDRRTAAQREHEGKVRGEGRQYETQRDLTQAAREDRRTAAQRGHEKEVRGDERSYADRVRREAREWEQPDKELDRTLRSKQIEAFDRQGRLASTMTADQLRNQQRLDALYARAEQYEAEGAEIPAALIVRINELGGNYPAAGSQEPPRAVPGSPNFAPGEKARRIRALTEAGRIDEAELLRSGGRPEGYSTARETLGGRDRVLSEAAGELDKWAPGLVSGLAQQGARGPYAEPGGLLHPGTWLGSFDSASDRAARLLADRPELVRDFGITVDELVKRYRSID